MGIKYMYKYNHNKEFGKNKMQDTVKITEDKAFEQDVKTMSYEELMDSIRYLDHERQMIADRVHPQDNNKQNQEKDKVA